MRGHMPLEVVLLFVMAFAAPLVVAALVYGPAVLEQLARRVAQRQVRRD